MPPAAKSRRLQEEKRCLHHKVTKAQSRVRSTLPCCCKCPLGIATQSRRSARATRHRDRLPRRQARDRKRETRTAGNVLPHPQPFSRGEKGVREEKRRRGKASHDSLEDSLIVGVVCGGSTARGIKRFAWRFAQARRMCHRGNSRHGGLRAASWAWGEGKVAKPQAAEERGEGGQTRE